MSDPAVDGDPRCLSGEALAAALRDSRRRTLALVDDLSDAQWNVPHQPGINPIAWELGHLAWFAEFWILRGPHRHREDGFVDAARPARIAGPDALYDSARLAHARRWQLAWPSREQVVERLAAQLGACLQEVPAAGDEAAYFHRLALFHEDMHGEAFAWLRAALGYPAPAGATLPARTDQAPLRLPGGRATIGWPAARPGFAFDNEQPGWCTELPAFEIDAQPVSAGRFLRFVEAGGYQQPQLWPGEAGRWWREGRPRHPARWRPAAAAGGTGWELRWFDRWVPLEPDRPVIHVNAFEAEAYCAWVGRRLPRAAEWEHAAATAGAGFAWGQGVWEWTADAFTPYAGFVPGPYRDYSAPWFGDHRELRGGSFATHARLHDTRYRNFFRPQRSDVFGGFRTAAGEPTGR